MNRTQILSTAAAVLLVCAIAYHIWANWGLITIHARNQPLGKVIATMESQGHARIETDLPTDTQVTMDCVKVPLADALETLSVVTDSRWRLLYFAAGSKETLKAGESAWFGGQHPDGWKMVSFPLGGNLFGDDDTPVFDPREDVWTPQTAAPTPVQNYFVEAAQLTNAGFAFPDTWNPTVNQAPPAGKVDHVVPKLISAVGGREDRIFFLGQNRGGGPRGGNGGGPTMAAQFNPEFIAARMQAEINRLPDDQRTEAQAAFDAEVAFRKSLAGMTDDQRQAAWMQHMQDPQVQQMMADRMDGRDGRMNHAQRLQRFSKYVSRKLAATGKM